MGKSIRCKVKKRLRTAKRQRVDAMICRPREQEHFAALTKQMQGQGITLSTPRNAFRYPNGKDAVFPQHEIMKPIDFRSENLPMAGYVYRGNRRKYEGEQKEYMERLARTSHPKMEVLAGGGAVLATTGEKVSRLEAELIATSVNKPEEAARLLAQPSASSAVATAVDANGATTDAAPATEIAEVATPATPTVEPQDHADHSRRPIVKDVGRQKRVAENQTRGTKSSRKHKPNPSAPMEERALVKKKVKNKGNSTKGDAKDMTVDA